MEPDEEQINLKTAKEQTPERVTVKRVKIDDEVIALDVVRRAEKRFVFEIMRDNGFKVRHVALHPSQDGRVSQNDSALGHHQDQVPGAEFERQVPPDAKDDNSLVKMPTLEEILRRGRFCHSSSYRRKPSLSSLHQNHHYFTNQALSH